MTYDELTPENRACIDKAKSGEPMFIILGRDPDGAAIVELWAKRRIAAGGVEHGEAVLKIANDMDSWRAAGNRPESAPSVADYPPFPGDAS